MTSTTDLSLRDQTHLRKLETIIQTAHRHILSMAKALCAIRDGRLYRDTHRTFGDYCEGRWGFSRAQGNRLCQWVEVSKNLSPNGDIPLLESHARPLAKLSRPQQRTAWKEISGEENITSVSITAICRRIQDEPVHNGNHAPVVINKNGHSDIAITRPLSWYGSKHILARKICSLMPAHKTYIEPFFGSGAVLFRKKPSFAEIVNDIDAEVVSFFRILRDPTQNKKLQNLLRLTPYARDEHDWCRENPECSDPIEQARRFYVRCRQSYASKIDDTFSLASTKNRAGEFVGPIEKMDIVIERLRRVQIENQDALELVPRFDQHDVVFYLDPPYVGDLRATAHRNVYAHEFSTEEDHRELLKVVKGMKKAKIILSGYRGDLYDRELAKWRRYEIPTTTNAARVAHGDSRKRQRTEVIWSNF
jgi:DNA adenine methylase